MLLTACPKNILKPMLLTETREGDPLVGQELQKTGSRKNVPVSEKVRHVVDQTHIFHSGQTGEIIITKGIWPWSDVVVYTNCGKCHKDMGSIIKNEQPKRPWWQWPVVIFGTLIIAFIFSILRVVISWIRKLGEKL